MITATKSAHDTRFTARRGRRKGATIVESAFVLLAVVAMIIFVVNMGWLLLMQQFCVARAHAGVRNAVVNNWGAAETANFVCYNSPTAPGGSAAPGIMGLSPSQVSYQKLGVSGASDYRLQVMIQGVQVFAWIPYMAQKYTLAPIAVTMPAQSLGATN